MIESINRNIIYFGSCGCCIESLEMTEENKEDVLFEAKLSLEAVKEVYEAYGLSIKDIEKVLRSM